MSVSASSWSDDEDDDTPLHHMHSDTQGWQRKGGASDRMPALVIRAAELVESEVASWQGLHRGCQGPGAAGGFRGLQGAGCRAMHRREETCPTSLACRHGHDVVHLQGCPSLLDDDDDDDEQLYWRRVSPRHDLAVICTFPSAPSNMSQIVSYSTLL